MFLLVDAFMVGVPFTVISVDAGNLTKMSGYDRKAFKRALGI